MELRKGQSGESSWWQKPQSEPQIATHCSFRLTSSSHSNREQAPLLHRGEPRINPVSQELVGSHIELGQSTFPGEHTDTWGFCLEASHLLRGLHPLGTPLCAGQAWASRAGPQLMDKHHWKNHPTTPCLGPTDLCFVLTPLFVRRGATFLRIKEKNRSFYMVKGLYEEKGVSEGDDLPIQNIC